jgi:hypothetical protein
MHGVLVKCELCSEAKLESIELTAVVVAVTDEDPRVLTIENGKALPTGAFASGHRSLQMGVRAWVEHQTHHPLGYLEQLYTFADRDRVHGGEQRMISISYLGLTREAGVSGEQGPRWHGWYRYFPWEDWREGSSQVIAGAILPRLRQWTREATDPAIRRERTHRMEATFPMHEHGWNEDLVLQRYELLYEAGMVREAARRRPLIEPLPPGERMSHDHRRILATGIARLRAKIKYRPIVFELMPPAFTLLQLQRAVEALAGRRLHKQNFRRLIEQQGLVEETGEILSETGGRPAKLFRFRREVVLERALTGSKLPLARPA